jgi:hypothetical protein
MRPTNTGDPIDLQEREHVSLWRAPANSFAGRRVRLLENSGRGSPRAVEMALPKLGDEFGATPAITSL